VFSRVARAPFGVVSCPLGVKILRAGEEVGTWTMILRLVEVGRRGEKRAIRS
jgi:hypothetical protein